MQIATALPLATHWRKKTFVNLLISPHPYWSRVDIESYRQFFDDIFILERPDYTCQPIRVMFWLWQIQRLKRRISHLGIDCDDIIVGLSVFHYLENIVLSTHRHNLKIAIMPAIVYEECTRNLDQDIYYTPPEGWVANLLVEPVAGLYRTYCKKEKLYPETYWRLRYRKPLLEIYDQVLVMGETPTKNSLDNQRIIAIPYPYVLALDETELEVVKRDSEKKVVFFGDSFVDGLWGVKADVYARYLNHCLSYLRTTYGTTHQLIYRPHPAETDEERKYLDLSQFEIETDGILAELYFYQNLKNIDTVFSVASTSSRAAFHFFLNAYSFIDIFPFDNIAKTALKKEMGNVPCEFFIQELSGIQPRYVKPENMNNARKSCQNALDMVLQYQRQDKIL